MSVIEGGFDDCRWGLGDGLLKVLLPVSTGLLY